MDTSISIRAPFLTREVIEKVPVYLFLYPIAFMEVIQKEAILAELYGPFDLDRGRHSC